MNTIRDENWKNGMERNGGKRFSQKSLNYLANDPFPNQIHLRRELWSQQQINLYVYALLPLSLSLSRDILLCSELLAILRNNVMRIDVSIVQCHYYLWIAFQINRFGFRSRTFESGVRVSIYRDVTMRYDKKYYIVLSMCSCRLTLVK